MLMVHRIPEVLSMIHPAAVLLAASVIPACATAALCVDEQTTVTVEFRRAEFKPSDGLEQATVEGSGETIYLHKAAELRNEDIAEAKGNILDDDSLAISVLFTATGRTKMEKLSNEHINRPLAIIIDGKVTSAPVVRGMISERALITGTFTPEEIERILTGLRSERTSHARPAHDGEKASPDGLDRVIPDGQQRAVVEAGAAAMADLQGTWLWTSPDGTRTAPADEIWAEVHEDRLTVIARRAILFDFTFTVKPDASPKAMDLIDRRKDRRAQKLSAIYELNGDVLRICLPNDGHMPRPVEFKSPPAADTALIVLTRKSRE
jgi:uncharacterized protein (TIGR03067 family)